MNDTMYMHVLYDSMHFVQHVLYHSMHFVQHVIGMIIIIHVCVPFQIGGLID